MGVKIVLPITITMYICSPLEKRIPTCAGVMKLVDMPDLGSGAARRVGSSPITRTESPIRKFRTFFIYK